MDAQSILDGALQHQVPLTIVCGPPGSGKSRLLMEVAERVAVSRVSVSLELSKLLLEVPERQQPNIVDGWSGETGPLAVFDNLELLFTPKLRVDPVRWLLHHANRRTAVVAAWPGRLEGDRLTYATAGHPEYYDSPVPHCRIINIADVVLRSVPA